MQTTLSERQERDLLSRGFSRRTFGRVAALLAAGTALPFFNESSLAQLSASSQPIARGAVKIDANENPMGPCAEAIAAAQVQLKNGGRYAYGETGSFTSAMAEVEGIGTEHIGAYAGSSLPLHLAVVALTGPERPFVTADPGYEAGERAARFIGARVIRVPLTREYAHDVKAMAAASANAGAIYVCNPNNPTGTLTPRADIEWLVDNKPRGCVVLLDEAYIHLSGERGCADLVARGKDLIILRTFSKIYGMAGVRAGAALARPELLARIGQYNAGALPTTAMAAATASLKVPGLVAERRKIIAEIREDCRAFLRQHGFDVVPSASNKFMVDVKRPGGDIISALRGENIYIGRLWPSWPTFVRVTVGTQPEMERFKAAFLKVTA